MAIPISVQTQHYFLFTNLLFLLITTPTFTFAQQPFRPKALIIPVSKDPSTLQYITRIYQRTPLLPVSLVLDLGGPFLWVDCQTNYVSSMHRLARCRSSQCSLAGEGCNNDTCAVSPDNTVTGVVAAGTLAEDVLSVQSTDGSNPGRNATVSNFLFACAPSLLLRGLAKGVSGMAGLGQTRVALPNQLASAFGLRKKLAIFLTSSSTRNGLVFFCDGMYVFLPGRDVSESLTLTPLLSVNDPSEEEEYFINVKSIKVNEDDVAVNGTLLTKISTVEPYTVLESSIFEAVTEAFVKEAATANNLTRVGPVAPLEVCFSSENVVSTRLGPAVPTVELVLQNEGVVWRVFGANSMVEVGGDALCLGFVNGGTQARTLIVIGGYQLEDNLLQFDLGASRLGFSSSLLGRQTNCANFNFTSNA